MNTEEIIRKARELRTRIQSYKNSNVGWPGGAAKAQVCEFLRTYAGPKSAFLQQAESLGTGLANEMVTSLSLIIQSFVEYLEAGLASGTSPERKGQLDVVSDILQQANALLDDSGQHPAAAAVLIGAALEQFLRTSVEAAALPLESAKPSIDAYCKCLRAAELLSKQDVKDITSWAGIRNHAAHGEWDQVSDRGRIRLMLEGVNLFMRQKDG
jgi:hypothetical protein